MSLADQDLVVEFVTESLAHLADSERQLLEIEATAPQINVELVNAVFRAVHSIKGAAGFLGLHTINQLAHHLESVLNLMRNQRLVPSAATIDTLLRSVDCLRSLLGNVEQSNETNVSQLIDTLQTLELANGDAAGPGTTLDEPASLPIVESTGYGRTATSHAPGPTAEHSIRVPVHLLDGLMSLAGELVLGRNRLLQAIEEEDDRGLEAVGARLNQVTHELQAAVMRSRMQPIGNVFTRFHRVVRDLSARFGKQVELVVEGQDVELDKAIVEAIGDPLTHLIRNSFDHGLETPEQRVLSGKPACGTIRLKATHQAGGVRITIEDDGAGIDGGRVKARAVARSLISAEQAAAMSDRDALRLIFLPGFSTAEQITELSGRGVGMDVVKTNIARLGGTVDVETNVGRGTTIDIKLPLTLAIMSSLVVRSAGQRFAIPQNSIREIVRIRRADVASRIERIKDALVLRLRGQLLPLVGLGDVLGIPKTEQIETVIVIEVGRLCYGLIVGGVDDAEEIVVKPLGRHLKHCFCFTGAAVLGSGRVALILDVGGIADHAELAKPKERVRANHAIANVDEIAQQSVLLFANGPSERFAVPANQVKRIERIAADQIDSIGGCAVLQYSSCALPLLSLEDYIRAMPRPQCKRLFVVVFEVAGRELGLLAPRIHEIRTVPSKFDTSSFREPGVSGSIVLDGKTVRIVDLPTLGVLADARRRDPSTAQSSGIEPWPAISTPLQNVGQARVPVVVGGQGCLPNETR